MRPGGYGRALRSAEISARYGEERAKRAEDKLRRVYEAITTSLYHEEEIDPWELLEHMEND